MTCPICNTPTDQHGAMCCDRCNPDRDPPCFLSPDALPGWTWAHAPKEPE